MPVHEKCKLLEREKLTEGIYRFKIETEEIAKNAKPRTIFRDKSY